MNEEVCNENITLKLNPNNEVTITPVEEGEGFISLKRAKKYARHQHFLGTQGKDLVEFEDWAYKLD